MNHKRRFETSKTEANSFETGTGHVVSPPRWLRTLDVSSNRVYDVSLATFPFRSFHGAARNTQQT